jgi:hypothetical protein
VSLLVLIVFVVVPRLVLVLVYNNSYYLQHAFNAFTFPLYGFLFLPLTTLAYSWMINTGQPITGYGFLILITSIAIDLGSLAGLAFRRRGD